MQQAANLLSEMSRCQELLGGTVQECLQHSLQWKGVPGVGLFGELRSRHMRPIDQPGDLWYATWPLPRQRSETVRLPGIGPSAVRRLKMKGPGTRGLSHQKRRRVEMTFSSRGTLALRMSCCGFEDQMEDTALKRRCMTTLLKERARKGMRCQVTGLKFEDVDVLERMGTLRAEPHVTLLLMASQIATQRGLMGSRKDDSWSQERTKGMHVSRQLSAHKRGARG